MIASARDYEAQLHALLPQGQAWVADKESVLSKVLGGLAPILARVHARALVLRREADPRTALEMLVDWERVCGLPDKCSPPGETIQERRTRVIVKLNERGRQDIHFFESMAQAMGYRLGIKETRPFVCGHSRCGLGRLVGPASRRFVWRALVRGQRIVYFRAGVSQCGIDPLAKISRAETLECLLHRFKPAHTKLTVGYTQ
ncbi:MAG: putative phage tail protein [Pseudomonadota bacterium]